MLIKNIEKNESTLKFRGGKFVDSDELEYVTVPRALYKAADHLSELGKHKSPNGIIETEADWKILIELYKVWRSLYPHLYDEFIRGAKMYRELNSSNKGFNKVDTALLQHQLEIPESFHILICTLFPLHSYTKEFVKRLTDELPEFNVSGA